MKSIADCNDGKMARGQRWKEHRDARASPQGKVISAPVCNDGHYDKSAEMEGERGRQGSPRAKQSTC